MACSNWSSYFANAIPGIDWIGFGILDVSVVNIMQYRAYRLSSILISSLMLFHLVQKMHANIISEYIT